MPVQKKKNTTTKVEKNETVVSKPGRPKKQNQEMPIENIIEDSYDDLEFDMDDLMNSQELGCSCGSCNPESAEKKHMILIALLILNLLGVLTILFSAKRFFESRDALQYGGMENYQRLKKEYRMDPAFSNYTKNQIDFFIQKLQDYKNGAGVVQTGANVQENQSGAESK